MDLPADFNSRLIAVVIAFVSMVCLSITDDVAIFVFGAALGLIVYKVGRHRAENRARDWPGHTHPAIPNTYDDGCGGGCRARGRGVGRDDEVPSALRELPP